METIRLCPQCQQPLAPDAPAGLCPQCLLKAAAAPPPAPSDSGLAVVYKARQRNLDRIVALKILPPVDALSPDFVARFTREARALAKLNHPNIVSVHDFGESGGLYYIVMEFV